jgi:hypothetical protein
VSIADILLAAGRNAQELRDQDYAALTLRELVDLAAHRVLDLHDPILTTLADYVEPTWREIHSSPGRAVDAWYAAAPRQVDLPSVLGQAAVHAMHPLDPLDRRANS